MSEGRAFIHVEDPGFPEWPLPGFRRLGPFDTHEEAVAQAVSDAAVGSGAFAVYPEEASERLINGERAAAHMTAKEVAKRGAAEARRRAKAASLESGQREKLLRGLMGDEMFEQAREGGLL